MKRERYLVKQIHITKYYRRSYTKWLNMFYVNPFIVFSVDRYLSHVENFRLGVNCISICIGLYTGCEMQTFKNKLKIWLLLWVWNLVCLFSLATNACWGSPRTRLLSWIFWTEGGRRSNKMVNQICITELHVCVPFHIARSVRCTEHIAHVWVWTPMHEALGSNMLNEKLRARLINITVKLLNGQ